MNKRIALVALLAALALAACRPAAVGLEVTAGSVKDGVAVVACPAKPKFPTQPNLDPAVSQDFMKATPLSEGFRGIRWGAPKSQVPNPAFYCCARETHKGTLPCLGCPDAATNTVEYFKDCEADVPYVTESCYVGNANFSLDDVPLHKMQYEFRNAFFSGVNMWFDNEHYEEAHSYLSSHLGAPNDFSMFADIWDYPRFTVTLQRGGFISIRAKGPGNIQYYGGTL